MSLLVISEILALFVKTVTANGKYCLPYSENLEQPIQKQLYKEQIYKQIVKSTNSLWVWNLQTHCEHFE